MGLRRGEIAGAAGLLVDRPLSMGKLLCQLISHPPGKPAFSLRIRVGRARAQRRWGSFRQADLYPTVYVRPSEMLPWAPTWLAPAGSRQQCQGQTWTPSPPPPQLGAQQPARHLPFPSLEGGGVGEASAQLHLHPAPGDVTRAPANTNTLEAPPSGKEPGPLRPARGCSVRQLHLSWQRDSSQRAPGRQAVWPQRWVWRTTR